VGVYVQGTYFAATVFLTYLGLAEAGYDLNLPNDTPLLFIGYFYAFEKIYDDRTRAKSRK
jgi:hypothetical protein